MAASQIKLEGTTQTLLAVRDVQLECVLHRNAYAGKLAVIVLHPYSWLGGCMRDHVTTTLFRSFAETEVYNTVLMYNSRGVGKSSGRASVYGSQKEVEDLKALCQLLMSNLTHPPEKVLLVGYSHGSCVASGAACESYIAGVMAVSPPVGDFASTMLGTKQLWKTFCASSAPKFVALGTADTFCSVKALNKKVAMSQAHVDVKIYETADHFWLRQLENMRDNVLQWAINV